MKKLVKKNYNQEQSLNGYYYSCTCLCSYCTCKVINALKIGSDSSSHGLNVDTSS